MARKLRKLTQYWLTVYANNCVICFINKQELFLYYSSHKKYTTHCHAANVLAFYTISTRDEVFSPWADGAALPPLPHLQGTPYMTRVSLDYCTLLQVCACSIICYDRPNDNSQLTVKNVLNVNGIQATSENVSHQMRWLQARQSLHLMTIHTSSIQAKLLICM